MRGKKTPPAAPVRKPTTPSYGAGTGYGTTQGRGKGVPKTPPKRR